MGHRFLQSLVMGFKDIFIAGIPGQVNHIKSRRIIKERFALVVTKYFSELNSVSQSIDFICPRRVCTKNPGSFLKPKWQMAMLVL